MGIDEVGRGCWAGPLVAGAVVLGEPIEGLKDSKLLTKNARNRLASEIKTQALAIGLGWVDASTIDRVGITTAVKLAMEQALAAITIAYDEVVIDGHLNFLAELPKTRALIKADALMPSVSAASIVAKVARDTYMEKLAAQLPQYGFDRHVGYGTALHLERLQKHGVTEFHRQSYKPIRALLQ